MKLSENLIGPEAENCDVNSAHDVMAWVGDCEPAAIINLAAATLPHTEADGRARAAAQSINHYAVKSMAEIATIAYAPIVYISTDCVFDGTAAEPYRETAMTGPLNTYGRSKMDGEYALAFAQIPHIILRTTGVYLRGKPNFLETVLAKAEKGETLECVGDTLYTPTDARELARAILLATERVIEDPSVSGTYHFAGPDVMSYLDFARLVAEESGTHVEIKPVTAAEREAVEGFKRPKNAALNSDKFAAVFGMRHRPTRECVRELVNPAR